MREILFRGKTDKGEWVQGDLTQFCIDEEITSKISFHITRATLNGLRTVTYTNEVIPETIGQYTGLTDKNGKKIFECDILEFNYTGNSKGVEGKAVVVFENGKFGVKWGWHKEFVALDGFANTTLTVIGNIHDNPELLKELGNNG